MRIRHVGFNQFERFARINKIIDYQHTGAVTNQIPTWAFDDPWFRLRLMIIRFYADCIDHANIQFAGHDHRGGHTAACDRHHGPPRSTSRSLPIQPPSQCARIAVQLIPTDVKAFFMWQSVHFIPLRDRHRMGCSLCIAYLFGHSFLWCPQAGLIQACRLCAQVLVMSGASTAFMPTT